MKSLVVIDLEAVVDPTIPQKPPKAQSFLFDTEGVQTGELHAATPQFPDSASWEITCAGYAVLGADYKCQTYRCASGASEREIVEGFFRYVEDAHPTIVTWNGRGFDLPVLQARAMKYGISAPYFMSLGYRYKQDGHYDVMDVMSNYGSTKSLSLDRACKLIGLPGKTGESGKDVATMIAEGRLDDVKAYCLSDVIQTTILLIRFELLRGVLTRARYQDALSALRDRVNLGDPLPKGFALSIDWQGLGL